MPRQPGGGLLIPVALVTVPAAIAVVAILIGGGSRAPGAGAAARAVLRQLPRYYLELTPASRAPGGPDIAVIRNTLTGAVLATVRPPGPYRGFSAATGAAGDRTFVLAAQPRPYSARGPAAFFLARFDPAARAVRLTALPVPVLPPSVQLTGLALAPGGGALAVAVATGTDGRQAQVRVYPLAGRTAAAPKTWQSQGVVGWDRPSFDNLSMSWARAGILAVNWWSFTGSGDGVRLLNTGTPAGSLVGSSRLAVPADEGDLELSWDGIATPGGAAIAAPLVQYLGDLRVTPRQVRRWEAHSWAGFREFATATGRMGTVLRSVRWPAPAQSAELVAWSNPAGSVLVVLAPPGGGTEPGSASVFGVLVGHRFAPLPGAPVPRGLPCPVPVF